MIHLPGEDNTYGTIVLDPGWDSTEKGCRGFKGVPGYEVHPTYDTLSLAEIRSMGSEVNRVAQRSCHLWMWTIELFLTDAIDIVNKWGFTKKRVFLWIKTTDGIHRGLKGLEHFPPQRLREAFEVMTVMGLTGKPYSKTGYWSKMGVEFLIMGTNDKSLRTLNGKNEYQTIFAPCPAETKGSKKGKHSKKPPQAFDLINRNSPGPRLSIFEREHRPGYICFGNELPRGAE